MKTKILFAFLFLGLLGIFCLGNDNLPMAISPGVDGGIGIVDSRCPTFSWSGVAWAEKYQVSVFMIEEMGAKAYEEMTAVEPVLTKEIAGSALSWTPSLEQGLPGGIEYVWYIGAMDAAGNWLWSEGRRFRVEENVNLALIEQVRTGLKQQGVKNEVIDKVLSGVQSGLPGGKPKDSRGDKPLRPLGTEGTYSTFYGTGAGANNSNDNNCNSFFGRNAGYTNTNGACNTFIGLNAGFNNTTGHDNTFMGDNAGYSNTTGLYNTFLGRNAGFYNDTGSGNVFLGYNAGYNETGSDKLYIDNSNTSSPLIYGDFSANMLGINGWLGVGTQVPAYPMELKTTGRNAAFVANRTDGAINFINATATYGQFGTVNNYPVRILVNANPKMTLNANNSLSMASGATCTVGGVWQNASSRSLKENIVDLETQEAMETLKGLTPVKFTYKADSSDEQVGFIAEDVPDLVATKDRKGMSAMDVVAVLTKVVQEQQKMVQDQQKALSEQKKINLEQQNAISTLKVELSELKRKSSMEK